MNNCKINQGNVLDDIYTSTADLETDVYLVELSARFSVISCAPRSKRLVLGADISEILSFNISHKLRKYLFSYEPRPIVIPTLAGDALILPQLFSSSRLFAMVFFKHSKPDALLRIASSERFDARVGLLESRDLSKMSKWDEPLADRLDSVLNIADNMLEKSLISVIDDRECIVEKCNMLFDNIALLTGVRVNLSVEEDVLADECFDAKLFSAFCLSMILLGARYAKADTADARIFQKDFGLSVSISFESAKKISRVLNPDIAHFNAISDANNMIFYLSFERGRCEMSFTPARKDWSLLELKFPSEFTI